MPERASLTVSDGVRLRVETSGPSDAPITVVLLHGWCLDRHIWRHQIAALRDSGTVRIVAYDARGHGGSGATRLSAATLSRLGEDLAAVLRRHAPRGPVVLVGHSMGGMTIMEYAAAHPDEFADRVRGLLFVSTTAEGVTHTRYGLPDPLAMLMRIGETVGAGVLARCGAWRPHRAALPVLRPAVRWLLFGDDCDGPSLDATMRAVGRATLRSIGGFRPSIGAQHRLATLTSLPPVPAAALVGDRDRLTPPPCAESIAEALAGAELTVCPGAGHMLMLERGDEVTATLSAIVARAAAAHRRDRRTPPPTGLERAA
ncbi:alpha/beta fold hydrolase [Mangrovihabitans endophyticus]|uniref:Alpha/beta hydrolase n=1 Tax=Mangrovihabitans endophyticus TaxID=1751298 RepID=A0A8J3FPB1_9ACTN|nr:alpha/beta hydrolase [Mangrovihabitans endophyticus]GGK88505.1 alpha/beta hydrolase [Mangrovihabitans endophyticus]